MRDKHDSGATGDDAPDTARRTHVTAREARLAAALRDNLRRRKAQARGRQAEQGESSTASGGAKRLPPSE